MGLDRRPERRGSSRNFALRVLVASGFCGVFGREPCGTAGETRPRPNTGNPVRDTRVELLRLDDLVALGAQARDAHLDHVAWLQVTRWLRAVTHARRRPGGDHV